MSPGTSLASLITQTGGLWSCITLAWIISGISQDHEGANKDLCTLLALTSLNNREL